MKSLPALDLLFRWPSSYRRCRFSFKNAFGLIGVKKEDSPSLKEVDEPLEESDALVEALEEEDDLEQSLRGFARVEEDFLRMIGESSESERTLDDMASDFEGAASDFEGAASDLEGAASAFEGAASAFEGTPAKLEGTAEDLEDVASFEV